MKTLNVRGVLLIAVVSSVGLASFTEAEVIDSSRCGSLTNAFGPFDYRSAPRDKKNLVEVPHYQDQAAAVRNGNTRARGNEVMDDLDYTLRVFPNHPGALMAIDQLGRLLKSEQPYKARWILECYYNRGVRMAPDDGNVYLVYSIYLQRRGRVAESKGMVDQAVAKFDETGAWTANAAYNVGLVYFELRDYVLAQKYAEQAEVGGFGLPGLKAKLQRSGHWTGRRAESATRDTDLKTTQPPTDKGSESATKIE